MGETTAIAWTDHTFNPWWGCERVSPGCKNCYAEALAKRYGHDVWGKKGHRRRFGDKHWAEPMKWQRAAEAAGRPALVFCASMADVFEHREDHHDDRARLWKLIEQTPDLIWLLLTKRPQNVLDMVPSAWLDSEGIIEIGSDVPVATIHDWPANVWVGTTVEDQERANERIPHLLDIPAPVRFLSCEPLLESVTFRWAPWAPVVNASHLDGLRPIEWVIVGGESGGQRRPFDLQWARDIRDECTEAGVPFFFKQVGGRWASEGGDELDGVRYKAFPPEARRETAVEIR